MSLEGRTYWGACQGEGTRTVSKKASVVSEGDDTHESVLDVDHSYTSSQKIVDLLGRELLQATGNEAWSK